MCTDYRKVNSVTKTDTFPIPRIDDCIDNIGHAKYVTKFDLLKGFWQIPLTDRAKEISAFVTPDGLYQYKVMPFGMKNIKIELRSSQSSKHINERRDGPYHGFGYLSLFSDPLDLAKWGQREIL